MIFDAIWKTDNGSFTVIKELDEENWENIKIKAYDICVNGGFLRISRNDGSIIDLESNSKEHLVTYIPPHGEDEDVPEVLTLYREITSPRKVVINGNYWDERMITLDASEVVGLFHSYIFQGEGLQRLT